MPPFGEALELLRRHGFERLLDMPALPGADRWKIRRHETTFALLTVKWRRMGLSRVYSLGWGLTSAGTPGTVLLVEAHGVASELADAVVRGVTGWFGDVTHELSGGTLKLAASTGTA